MIPEPRPRHIHGYGRQGIGWQQAEHYRTRTMVAEAALEQMRSKVADLEALLLQRAQAIAQGQAERDEAVQKIGRAMWAFIDHLKKFQHPVWWPAAVKDAFSEAIIDRSPLSDDDIQRTLELAEQFGWKKTDEPADAARVARAQQPEQE